MTSREGEREGGREGEDVPMLASEMVFCPARDLRAPMRPLVIPSIIA
jgi:hypothetical protein